MGESIRTVGDLAGICGHDGTDWIKALIDATGHLQVDVVDSGGADLKDILDKLADILTELNAKLETADLDLDASGRLSANQHHYDGSAWRKSNLLFGYNDIWDENLGGSATGTSYLKAATTVPANQLWILQAASIVNQTRNVTAATVYVIRSSGSYVMLADTRPCAQYKPTLFTGVCVLAEGDILYIAQAGTQAGDSILGGLVGYKMKLDM